MFKLNYMFNRYTIYVYEYSIKGIFQFESSLNSITGAVVVVIVW